MRSRKRLSLTLGERWRAAFLPAGFTLVAAVCAGCARPSPPDWIAMGASGMVAADHSAASQAGVEVLKSGGNAVDAAVAVSLALAVTRPQSTGLGGGGFTIVRWAETGEVAVFDHREVAPAAASKDMYTRAVAENPIGAPPSRYGHLAVAVPGQLAGLAALLDAYGTRSLETLSRPAIRLADQGFAVDEPYVLATRNVLDRYARYPELRESCPYVYNVHLRGGNLRAPGDTLCQPRLARLLRLVAKQGVDAFYRGAVAKALAREMASHGGAVREADLAAYRVSRRQPLVSTYGAYHIITMPPPSSGGTCLIETLNILEAYQARVSPTEADGYSPHVFVEAMKHAFADRARWLGDADFVPVPVDLLTSKVYAQILAEAIDPEVTVPVDTYGTQRVPDDAGTSHFCIVDRWGNCVVSTETVNTEFGSLAAVAEWGLILNNEMDDFTAEPGKANFFGLIQSSRNAVQPGKRPLSSMTPTIVLRNDKPFLLLGASGGPRIISSVLNVMTNVLDRKMSLVDAMLACRIHHQWMPDEVFFDRTPPLALAAALRQAGHTLSATSKTGIVQAILRTAQSWKGASDPRKQGQPKGY